MTIIALKKSETKPRQVQTCSASQGGQIYQTRSLFNQQSLKLPLPLQRQYVDELLTAKGVALDGGRFFAQDDGQYSGAVYRALCVATQRRIQQQATPPDL